MKKIKILFTIPNFDTAGSQKPLFEIAKLLDKNKFIVEIVCLHNRGDFFQKVLQSGIKIHIIDLYKNARPVIKMLKECYQLSKIFKKINPHIIHSYNYAADYTEPLAAKMAGIKWIYTKKNMSWQGPSYRGWEFRSWLSDGIIAQNSDMMNDFFPGRKNVKLIPIGIDSPKYKLDMKNKSKKNSKRYLITVANLIEIKGTDLLIKAFSKINNEYPEWNMLIIGDNSNPYGKYCIDLSFSLELTHKITFTGKIEDTKKYLDQAEIFVLPSIKGEGGPVAILEAMANQKNIIASNVAGIRDQLAKFKEHMFEAGNEIELINKLKYFMNCSVDTNNRLGKVFYDYVVNYHDISIERNKLQQYYQFLLEE
jgi:glycosyltransferase involved in cell wall biosynthesis